MYRSYNLGQAMTLTFLMIIGLHEGRAQIIPNDLLFPQQRPYLSEIHRIDQAWQISRGSSSTRIGIYSFVGLRTSHEDLQGRVLTPVGINEHPELDVATEMAGIIGANTNNGKGIAGIDWNARLQFYSLLRPPRADDFLDGRFTIRLPGGANATYYLDLRKASEMLEQGRNNGVHIHLFSFGLPSGKAEDYPLPEPPQTWEYLNMPRPIKLEDIGKKILEAAKKVLQSYCSDAEPFSWILGSCYSPPDPFKLFRESIGRAVQDGGVVIAPAGDLEDENLLPTEFQPGQFEKYAVTVGGVTFDPEERLVPWAYTRPADYVDVAAFAGPVIGPSGQGDQLYNFSFTSTAAAASIVAGVSALIKAVRPELSGEDVEQTLRRTARSFNQPVPNEHMGYGVVDARAALEFVVNNDIQRVKKRVDRVITNTPMPISGQEWIYLKDFPLQYYPRSYCPYALYAYGKRYEFTARVEFPRPFEASPQVWVRWADSDGVDTRFKLADGGVSPSAEYVATYDPFWKDLTVISVDRNGFVIKGRYWYVRFYDALGRECTVTNYIPKRPEQFQIAYTAVGRLSSVSPPPAPANLRITNRGAVGDMPRLEWNASPGAEGYYLYRRCANNWTCQNFQRIATTTGTSWIDSGVIQGTYQDYYTYQVTAYNVAGESAPSNQVSTYGAPFTPYSLEALSDSLQLVRWVPETFALRVIGPNPFSTVAVLELDLPEAAQVRLVVFDVLGREIVRPVDQFYEAGRHRIRVWGENWPPGVYLYRLEAGNWVYVGTLVRR